MAWELCHVTESFRLLGSRPEPAGPIRNLDWLRTKGE